MLKVTWKKVEGATKYEVYRSTTGKSGSFALKKTTTSIVLYTSYPDAPLTAFQLTFGVWSYGLLSEPPSVIFTDGVAGISKKYVSILDLSVFFVKLKLGVKNIS